MTLDCLTSIKKYPQLKYRIAEEARLNPSAKLTCLYQYFFFLSTEFLAMSASKRKGKWNIQLH